MARSQKTKRRVQQILAKVQDYMDVRFAHASRVNPNIRHIYSDIRWQQLMSLKLILESSKAYGPDRYYVADILCEQNASRKKALFNPTDQNSILNEIINLKEEEGKQKRAGQLPISSMRTFYTALNPSLERIVELIQTWIWWDLNDASDLVAFEHQAAVIQQLHKKEIDGPLSDHYQKLLRKAASEIDKPLVLNYEFDRLEQIQKSFEERREFDEGYQMIVKRDVRDDKSLGEPYDYKLLQLKKLKAVVEKFRGIIPKIEKVEEEAS